MADTKERALQMLKEGVSPAEVARQLGISPATARTWKSRLKNQSETGQTVSSVSKKVKRTETPPIEEQLIDAVEKNKKLTDWQKVFCLHYSRTFNATASYRKARPECTYYTAGTEGSELLKNPEIRAEIQRLKKMRTLHMMVEPEDILRKVMDIAFADITEYVEFGRVEVDVMGAFGPVMVETPGTDEKTPLKRVVNDVRFRESDEVDGTLISEVKKGKDGASVKLADRMKALDWLGKYFEMHPADKHKREYDQRCLELKALQIQASSTGDIDTPVPDDGFLGALNKEASALWDADSPDDSHKDWIADNDLDTD